MGCVVGEGGFTVGVSDGIGGAGDLIDFGLGVRGFGWDGCPEAWECGGPEEGCGWAEADASGRLLGAGRFSGPSVWSTEHLLSSRIVNS